MRTDAGRLWAAMLEEPRQPPVGEWPAEPSPLAGLTVAMKSLLPEVHIALIPTDDWTTVPAHLRWGGGMHVLAPNIILPLCARGVIALAPSSLG
jgi:hypothetical protein